MSSGTASRSAASCRQSRAWNPSVNKVGKRIEQHKIILYVTEAFFKNAVLQAALNHHLTMVCMRTDRRRRRSKGAAIIAERNKNAEGSGMALTLNA